ncbi:hypothetical protein HOY80DRAFT_885249, partial [Tuber brumale]
YVNTTIEQLSKELTGQGNHFTVVGLKPLLAQVPVPEVTPEGRNGPCQDRGWQELSTIGNTWASFLGTNIVAENVLVIV